ncbi:MAG TPA: hypothetical protein VGI45_33330 [Terracidiphilus sp.]|jgi:hypothetical protein
MRTQTQKSFRCGAPLQAALGIALFLWVAALTGCSGCKSAITGKQATPSTPAISRGNSGEGSAHVSFRPEVVALEENDAVQSLRGVSSNGMAFVFDSGNSKIAGLKPNDVLFVKNRMARKILAVDRQGDETLILTRLASLPETLVDGRISLHKPMHFADLRAAAPPQSPFSRRLADALSLEPVYAQTQAQSDDAAINAGYDQGKKALNATIKGYKDVIDGWDTDFDATPENGKLHLALKLTRNLETVISEIDADGYLEDFDTLLDTSLSGGSLTDLEGTFKNVNGAMDIHWSIGQTKPGGDGKSVHIELPSIVSTSLSPLLDGLPIYLDISGAVIVQPVTTGGDEFASGSYHLTYDGYQHFKLAKSSLSSDGPINMSFDPGDAKGISLAPTAMVLALAAPRIQLTFGGPALDVFNVKGLKEASDTVDKWADKVAQKYLSPDAYQLWKGATDTINQAISAVQNTGAMAYLRVLTTTTAMHGGSATMFPCRRETWDFFVTVGVSAQALGVPAGSLSTRIAEKKIQRQQPPDGGLCRVN